LSAIDLGNTHKEEIVAEERRREDSSVPETEKRYGNITL